MSLFNFLKTKKPEKERKMVRCPNKGYAWNPLRQFPPNAKCWCGSLKKSKKCCATYLSDCLLEESAEFIKKNWDEIVNHKVILPKALPKEKKDE